ncbi:MAG TPA: sigma-54 dependent transcriptional regulator [Polyangiaceae bacterium]|nr:sigma-54 dependent transcriptional regulator [Polyangiaceae bacterium]
MRRGPSSPCLLGRVLIVDDDRATCELLADGLSAEGFDTVYSVDPLRGLELAAQPSTAAVITDVGMPKMLGIELCRRVTARSAHVPVIVVTACGSVESAIAAMKAGAYDFVAKPFDVDVVAALVRRALAAATRRPAPSGAGPLLGASAVMREVRDLIERVASSEVPVLLTGESGTGKELVAREIHRQSSRASGEFVAINCAALPEALLESELFGHTRGAFTDAKTARTGLFERAHGGTLFLDEIGEMPIGLQPKLLRALQEGRVRPVGGVEERQIDARVIAATNRDLEAAIAERSFREDLYYRVNVVQIELPALRDRGDDVLLLARAMLVEVAGRTGRTVPELTPAVCDALVGYDWRGNVRELRNCIERAVALSRSPLIDVGDLPPRVREHAAGPGSAERARPGAASPGLRLEEVERAHILRVLEMCRGKKSAAAQLLGLNRKTLHRRLAGFGQGVAASDDAPPSTVS